MIRKFLWIAAVFLVAPAYAGCESGHWIQTKNDDGTLITLEDGSVWRVIDGGQVDSKLWLEVDDVLLCDDGTMINTSEQNEQVSVELLSRG
ncbi:hypothetical protein [Enterobacter sp. CP102]|uniref:hypothetical protein n=1 Tax=Enterobacter sp. CP102 TaxID=2976431 RepID=UPI0022090471|nr:hypothetical protein [Enterobacter sp. CP102]UWM62292.1 hypothetical protein N1249_11840 [Enterobacter sp. CP102]